MQVWRRIGDTGDICTGRGIDCNSAALCNSNSTQVNTVFHHRVDHKRISVIITAYRETYHIRPFDGKFCRYRNCLTIDLLVADGSEFSHISCRGCYQE